ncbi:hypothetical protein TU77_16060 [Pseudomonas synxantha]|nr:hypothetical protein TU77_16060 [Pseudomonas synxantha]
MRLLQLPTYKSHYIQVLYSCFEFFVVSLGGIGIRIKSQINRPESIGLLIISAQLHLHQLDVMRNS